MILEQNPPTLRLLKELFENQMGFATRMVQGSILLVASDKILHSLLMS